MSSIQPNEHEKSDQPRAFTSSEEEDPWDPLALFGIFDSLTLAIEKASWIESVNGHINEGMILDRDEDGNDGKNQPTMLHGGHTRRTGVRQGHQDREAAKMARVLTKVHDGPSLKIKRKSVGGSAAWEISTAMIIAQTWQAAANFTVFTIELQM